MRKYVLLAYLVLLALFGSAQGNFIHITTGSPMLFFDGDLSGCGLDYQEYAQYNLIKLYLPHRIHYDDDGLLAPFLGRYEEIIFKDFHHDFRFKGKDEATLIDTITPLRLVGSKYLYAPEMSKALGKLLKELEGSIIGACNFARNQCSLDFNPSNPQFQRGPVPNLIAESFIIPADAIAWSDKADPLAIIGFLDYGSNGPDAFFSIQHYNSCPGNYHVGVYGKDFSFACFKRQTNEDLFVLSSKKSKIGRKASHYSRGHLKWHLNEYEDTFLINK